MELTCINCPVGCRLQVEIQNGEVIRVTGNQCKRGEKYARQECIAPQRMITAVIPVAGSKMPLSVKTRTPIPKKDIAACMKELAALKVEAPVRMGDVICANVCAKSDQYSDNGALFRLEDRRLNLVAELVGVVLYITCQAADACAAVVHYVKERTEIVREIIDAVEMAAPIILVLVGLDLFGLYGVQIFALRIGDLAEFSVLVHLLPCLDESPIAAVLRNHIFKLRMPLDCRLEPLCLLNARECGDLA